MRGIAIDSMLINPLRRAVVCRDGVSAILITGYEKVRSGYGNGDCILLYPKNGIFAVSDSTERFPHGSRDLLQRLSSLLENEGVPGNQEQWGTMMKKVYGGQKYHFKATFSCAAVRRTEEGIAALIAHGGDSTVIVVDIEDGVIRHTTVPDMNFAGRSRHLSVVGEWQVQKPSERVVLCSDGVWDLLRADGEDPKLTLARYMMETPVADVPALVEKLVQARVASSGHVNFDDAAIIVLNPFSITAENSYSVLMGGTTPVEEGRYQRERESDDSMGRWIGAEEFNAVVSGNPSYGIVVW